MSDYSNGKAKINGSVNDVTNLHVNRNFVEGGASVSNFFGNGKALKGRNINAASSTYSRAKNSCIWSESDNVTEFYITCYDLSGVSSTDTLQPMKDFVLMVVDQETEAIASLALNSPGGQSLNTMYYSLSYGERHLFQGVDYFSILDFLPTIENTRIIIEAQ